MTAPLSRAVMALATHSLGHQRHVWAAAMQAEFDSASHDGKALTFAIGCLMAAWRDMPAHAEGRLRLARHAVALLLIGPVAALLLAGALFGMPYPDFAHAGLFTFRLGHAGHFLNDGNRAAAPVVTQLVVALALMHFAAAWAVLDRDWAHVAMLARLGAAATITLVIFSGLALLDTARTLLPVAALMVEGTAVWALVRLHAAAGEEHEAR